MSLWRYVLEADDKLNLADSSAGMEWFRSQWWMGKGSESEHGEAQSPPLNWSDRDRNLWLRNVLAFRVVVSGLMDREPRRKVRADSETRRIADKVLRGFLKKLRVVPLALLRKRAKRESLSQKNML